MASTLPLKIAGKTYEVPAPSIRLFILGAYVNALRGAQADESAEVPVRPDELGTDEQYHALLADMPRLALGTVHAQLVADDVSHEDYDRAAQAAIRWAVSKNRDAALAFFRGEDGESGRPKASTTTAAGDTTPISASTSGTKSRKPKKPASPPK